MMLPIFIHLYYMYQRKSKLSKIVVDYNNEKFLEKGFYVGKIGIHKSYISGVHKSYKFRGL